MSCNATDWYRTLSPLAEKIETLSRLNPCLESDEELAFTQSVLLSIISDYAQQLRHVLNDLATASPGEEASHE
jgi:hypothetical protein